MPPVLRGKMIPHSSMRGMVAVGLCAGLRLGACVKGEALLGPVAVAPSPRGAARVAFPAS